jgi:hypothetical protein
VASLRPAVRRLGVHLPFAELNAVSPNLRVAEASLQVFRDSIRFASRVGADYAVVHLRGGAVPRPTTPTGVPRWRPLLQALGAEASQKGLVLCVENADDLRLPHDLQQVLDDPGSAVRLCLDIGHLYERAYPPSLWRRGLLVMNDRFLPSPFFFKSGLPVGRSGDWTDWVVRFREKLTCLHIHNHDGEHAHRPLTQGKLALRPLETLAGQLNDVPCIVEADYVGMPRRIVRSDLTLLEELAARP